MNKRGKITPTDQLNNLIATIAERERLHKLLRRVVKQVKETGKISRVLFAQIEVELEEQP